MGDQESQLWVNTLFRGRQLAEFLAVKKHLGIQSNTDVVRHLIHKHARALSRHRRSRPPVAAQPAEPGPLATLEPLEPDGRGTRQSSARAETKALCFSCSLPDCDETSPRCLYRQAASQGAGKN